MVKALLVGIDAYPNPAHRLAGCRNDVAAIQELLAARALPGALSIETILDEQATREYVIARVRAHLGSAGPGDTALLYFAGHGSRERAPEVFWPTEPDRLDETLVLWDSRLPGNWDLADKELAALIREVAAPGGHVVVILDCCHSGSGTREIGRAGDVLVRRMPIDTRMRPLETFLPDVRAVVGAADRPPDSGWDLGDDGRHILLAACCDDQEASELAADGKKHGAFSHFLVESLRDTPGVVTYRDLAAMVRARVVARVSNQAPQVEATVEGDLDRAFLAGALQPRARGFVASEEAGSWWMDAGRLHGVPVPRGAECARVALFTGTATAAEMSDVRQAVALANVIEVDAVRSRLDVPDGALVAGRVYKAVVTATPLRGRGVRVSGSAVPVAAAREALARGVAVTEAGDSPDFHLVCADEGFEVRRASDDRPLVAPARTATEALQQLEHITRWQFFAELENPVSAIADDEFEVAILAGRKGDEVLPGTDLRLSAGRDDKGRLVAPEFRIRFANRGTRELFFGVLALDELFACSTDLVKNGVQKLAPGDAAGWALDGRALKSAIPQALRDEGRTESRDILKVIVSTAPFEIRHASMAPLGAARRAVAAPPAANVLDRLLARGQNRTISAASDDDEIRDFRARTIVVTTVEPRTGVDISPDVAVDLGAGVSIEPHPALGARARLTSLVEARSDAGVATLPPLFRAGDAGETVRFSASRGAAPALSVVELQDVSDYQAVTPERPLTIGWPEATAPGDVVLPVGYDGEDYLVLGHGGAHDGATRVTLTRLPHPIGKGTRSLTGSVKIMFQKFTSPYTGTAYRYPLLAGATWDAEGKVRYDLDRASVSAAIANATRVVVFVHGIIGDTLAMGARLAPRAGDVYLAFDYENLHTTIEANAEALKARLIDVGLVNGHGKDVVIVAHSMGGLVTRWFTEKLGGRQMVSRVILCGTPSAGSNWATVEDWITATASLALNQLTKVSWEARAVGMLFGGIERIDNSLDQMRPGSAFLVALGALDDPALPYTVLAGNTSLASEADAQRVRRLLKKVVYRTLSLAFLFEPNDVAVSVASIGAVGATWAAPPDTREVACDHMHYFSSEAGVGALRALLDL